MRALHGTGELGLGVQGNRVEVADGPLHKAKVGKDVNFCQVLAATVFEEGSLQRPRWVALP